MIRTVLAIAAGLLCAAAGWRRGQGMRADCLRQERWAAVMRHLSLLLEEGAGSLPEVLEMAAREDALPDRLLRTLADNLRTQPLKAPGELLDLSVLPLEEREIVLRLMRRLGHGSRESRCQAADMCGEEMRLLASSRRVQAETEAKMWRQLGLLGGLCLTLWLL
ncbi:MAG: hypothetical protein ACI4O7_00500 [Aristaeellaceae bacterium]